MSEVGDLYSLLEGEAALHCNSNKLALAKRTLGLVFADFLPGSCKKAPKSKSCNQSASGCESDQGFDVLL